MTIYRENILAVQALQKNSECLIQGIGNSMVPLLKSGDICRVVRVEEDTELKKGDIVFCKAGGHFYLHKITAINGKRYQIGNNHGHVNGWVGRKNIYGKVAEVVR